MTLEQLRIFVAVAERAHATRAAEALHLTQPAVSAAIAKLEVQHKVRLFERVGRHLELSAAGRAFLPEARGVLQSAQGAARALDELANLKRGSLAIVASQTVSNYWLPSRMAFFAKTYPAIALTLADMNTAQVAEAVARGDAELGIVEGEIKDPLLARRKVGGDRIAIYAASKHPLNRKRVALSDLAKASWMLREPGSGTRAHFEHALKGSKLDVRLELPSNEGLLAAVAGSDMLTAVSELAAAPHVAAGLIARIAYDLPPRNFDLLTARTRRRSAAAKAFLETIGTPAS